MDKITLILITVVQLVNVGFLLHVFKKGNKFLIASGFVGVLFIPFLAAIIFYNQGAMDSQSRDNKIMRIMSRQLLEIEEELERKEFDEVAERIRFLKDKWPDVIADRRNLEELLNDRFLP